MFPNAVVYLIPALMLTAGEVRVNSPELDKALPRRQHVSSERCELMPLPCHRNPFGAILLVVLPLRLIAAAYHRAPAGVDRVLPEAMFLAAAMPEP